MDVIQGSLVVLFAAVGGGYWYMDYQKKEKQAAIVQYHNDIATQAINILVGV